MHVFYAIGDIHGRIDLLTELHDAIQSHHAFFYAEAEATLVHIGDYIDGGPDSRAVLDTLEEELPGFKTICLKGNHEDLLLQCLLTDERDTWHAWLSNGGEATLKSFGISRPFGGYDSKALGDALGTKRIAWLRALPLVHETDAYIFVHAGLAPGIPLGQQSERDLLWIRSRFLESDVDHGRLVIHGHTPNDVPEVKPNRINIDTGATSNGVLTAVVFAKNEAPLFLRAQRVMR